MRMLEISTDYLIVGAGAMGMGFLDELVTCSQLEAVIVDTRDKPGGHWNQVQYVTVQYSTQYTLEPGILLRAAPPARTQLRRGLPRPGGGRARPRLQVELGTNLREGFFQLYTGPRSSPTTSRRWPLTSPRAG